MMNVVYLDVYFCFNFLMDFFIFYLTSKFLNHNNSRIRLFFASFFGALYSTIILAFGNSSVIESVITYVIVPLLISLLLVKIRTIQNVIKYFFLLYLAVFVVSGIINAIYYSSKLGESLVNKATTANIGGINVSLILIVILFFASIVEYARKKIKKDIRMQGNLYEVMIVIDGQKISARGLRDTGNQLIEPITGKPVVIIEENLLKKVNRQQLKRLVIPFNSVGKQHGLMEGFVGELLEVEGYIINKPILGIHNGRLSGKKEYNLILPPNIFEEERV